MEDLNKEKQAFEHNIEKLLHAIHVCLDKELILPSLLLLYAGIDIMASLCRPESHEFVKQEDFLNWTDEYLLPDSGLPCGAIDIFAARCSLLHSYTAESKLSRDRKAKRLFYTYGEADVEKYQKRLDEKHIDAIAISANDLVSAFCDSIIHLQNELSNDPHLSSLVNKRSSNFFFTAPITTHPL
jgi:hypothetical protein